MSKILSKDEVEGDIYEPTMRATIESLARYINFSHANSLDDLKEFEDLTILLREKGWLDE
jgi:hypothetical protein